MKNLINKILRKTTGYQVVRYDASPYMYRKDLYEFVSSYSPAGKMLDVGSAYGSYMKDNYKNVTTIDPQPPADVIGSIEKTGFEEGSFDVVTCLEVLEHTKNPQKAVDEIRRILKPGGRLIASGPFSYELHGEEYGDYWRFSRQGWEVLMKDFKKVIIRPNRDTKIPMGYFVTGIK